MIRTVSTAPEQLARTIDEGIDCPQCHCLFLPARPHQRFCSTDCRRAFHKSTRRASPTVGAPARVASVRVLANETVSVVLHFKGDARSAAMRLHPNQTIRVVPK